MFGSILRVTKKFSSILTSKQKNRIYMIAVFMIAGGFLEMFSVSLILPFMDVIVNPYDTIEKGYIKIVCDILHIDTPAQFIIIVSVFMSVIYIFKNIFLIYETNLQYRFVYDQMYAMQKRMFCEYVYKPYEYFLNVESGEIIRVINSDISSSYMMLLTMLSFYTESIVSVMLVVTVFMITPAATAGLAAILLILLLAITTIIRPKLKKSGHEYNEAYAGMSKWLLQTIQGIKELKVMRREDYFQNNFSVYGKKYVNALRRFQVLSMTPRFVIEGISMGIVFIVLALLIANGFELTSIIPVMTAVAMAAVRLLPSINRMAGALSNITYNEPMLDKLISNLSELSSVQTVKDRENSCDLQNNDEDPVVRLKGVWFKYPNNEKYILEEADFNVRKGQMAGIIGGSGSGKTTAVDIILGLLHPVKGIAEVGGLSISENPDVCLSHIGYIPQSIFLLDDTIRENIIFGDTKEKGDEFIWKILKDAALEEFVSELENGLDTQIGERGVKLSGGQKQRIGIARALYRDPDILFFDEATSSLDNETEKSIMDSILRLHGKKTMIIIAHRLSTIESCDHIYRIDNGKIILVR